VALAAVIAALGVAKLSGPTAHAAGPNIELAGGPVLNFPGSSSGNTFNVQVVGVTDLGGYSVVAEYDESVITVTAVADISGLPAVNICPGLSTTDGGGLNSSDITRFAFESTCGTTGTPTQDGTIALVKVTFTCLGEGTSTAISFDSAPGYTVASVSSADADPATHTNGTVNCTAAPTATPIPSPTPLPEGPVFVKDVDPDAAGIQTSANLWLCTSLCSSNGQGSLTIAEVFFNPGEIGLGAFEFQVKFDHKVFDISISSAIADAPYPAPPAAAANTTVGDEDSYLASTGRTVLCDTTFTENYQLYACGSASIPAGIPGPSDAGPNNLAYIKVKTDADMYFRIRPTSMNGVVRILLDENCEAATELGVPFPGSVDGGLAPVCDDASVTVRILEGDLNLDCTVGLTDVFAISDLYGAFFGRLDYDPWYDLEPKITDFDIDIKDIQFVAGRLFSTCDNPIPAQPPATAHVVAGL
jgi:hypothetical protein